MISSLLDSFRSPARLARLAAAALTLSSAAHATVQKNLIIDTDLYSDVDDAGALLLASTLPNVNLLALNVDYPSSYSALAASAILAHYGHPDVPVGIRRPFTEDAFFDQYYYEMGEYASKVAYHWSNGTLTWGNAGKAWEPVALYRKTLAAQANGSVTIASIGFFENLSGLLNSPADNYSSLTGPDLVRAKVSELVVMGGAYPAGREYNFFGDNATSAAHVVNSWPGSIVFSGTELGGSVLSGASLTTDGPDHDPVKAAYSWYVGYNKTRYSWDPLTMLYAVQGLGNVFQFANEYGYNHVFANGSNAWVPDKTRKNQHWLELKVENVTAGEELDRLFLDGARSVL
ncbi:inosine/uridine-preferring nucleoside hydrolase [Saccharata proteae CBS 121410]|uniref:Inosine/uridine-preferring nucleoside hydrolase n=1 Tax=Saccharata proteae CBS 121410 TaxID=1314787 RepID=A0A9P4LW43_9PEZI|nr:inosine/uridine-preferring nucleoside hydrolase [Saccharata proteae CBS 121410]